MSTDPNNNQLADELQQQDNTAQNEDEIKGQEETTSEVGKEIQKQSFVSKKALDSTKEALKRAKAEIQELKEKVNPDKPLQVKLEELEAKFKEQSNQMEFAKKQSEIIGKLREAGLNPKKEVFVRNNLLNNLVNAEDFDTELENLKQEVPEFFKSDTAAGTIRPVGGGSPSKILTKAKALELLSSKSNAGLKDYTDAELYQAINQ